MFGIDPEIWRARGFSALPGLLRTRIRLQISIRLTNEMLHLGLITLQPASFAEYTDMVLSGKITWDSCTTLWQKRLPDRPHLLDDRMQVLLADLGDAPAHSTSDADAVNIPPTTRFPRSMSAGEVYAFADDVIALSADSLDDDVRAWATDPLHTLDKWSPGQLGAERHRSAMKAEFIGRMDDVLFQTNRFGLNYRIEVARRTGDRAALLKELLTGAPGFLDIASATMRAVTTLFNTTRHDDEARFARLDGVSKAIWSTADMVRATTLSSGISLDPFEAFDPRTPETGMHVTAETLASLGLADLPEPDAQDLIRQIVVEVENRVTPILGEGLTDAAAIEFERLTGHPDDDLYVQAWLQLNRPDYRTQVTRVFLDVMAEVRAAVPGIRARLLPEAAQP